MATAPQEITPANDQAPAPAPAINDSVLRQLGMHFSDLFGQFEKERRHVEKDWIRSLRQFLGIYDPEIERELQPNRSRAYPRLTRVKCISMLSRLMNLLFPGNEKNWELKASPSADMSPDDVAKAVQDLFERRQREGLETLLDEELVDYAVQELADKRAAKLASLIDDQLQEIGGDQTADFVALNRKVLDSGIKYGIGVLRGPFVREIEKVGWKKVRDGEFKPETVTIRKPQYEFLSVWDFYPDMTAKNLTGREGYFVRLVMGRSELRELADRPDFYESQVKKVIRNSPNGNYKPKNFETELRTLGNAAESEVPLGGGKDARDRYEVIIWNGPVSAQKLKDAGAKVPDSFMADDVEAELWIVGNEVIKAEVNAWRRLGMQVNTIHVFQFDEDDTSPIGPGLPSIVRDSQLSVCASTRMTLDNASVTCGPNLEVNMSLLRADQRLDSVEPYKIWYRDDTDPVSAQYPAVRQVKIDGHLGELQGLVKMFMDIAEMETFIGPQTGGDMTSVPSEAMRTAAGSSMLRADTALPFKDIVRNFDSFTQSWILSLVMFNKKFNPALAPEGDYNVIARGATSLIAKEVRAIQLDTMSQTLSEEERDHIDERKFVEQRFAVRDMEDMLVPPQVAKDRKDARQAQAAQEAEMSRKMLEAQLREVLSGAYKNVTQGQKNAAAADADAVQAAIDILERGLTNEQSEQQATSGGTGEGS